MKTRPPLKEIALQAGLSLATVDRALHDRPGLTEATKAKVRAAIAELRRSYDEAAPALHRLAIDVVMITPLRFSNAVRTAFESELPGMRPASFMARFHVAETMGENEIVALINHIRKRGSRGIILKVPATEPIINAARASLTAHIPVVTFVTDLPDNARIGYAGMDNIEAGNIAAHLMAGLIGGQSSHILATLSSALYSGEESRVRAFCERLTILKPNAKVTIIAEGQGLARTTRTLTEAALAANPEIDSVYSAGGGNAAILEAFAAQRRTCQNFIAHDLDKENTELLANGRIQFVLHHDLRQDARRACQLILGYHRMLPANFEASASRVEIATPGHIVK